MKNIQTNPICSICVANYNGEHVLADCIDSILAQTGDIAIEIIIHDDASSDNSISLLRERYSPEPSSIIRIIESEANVGFCVANNRMADAARGDYLLLLNNDAALAPDALETLLFTANKQTPQGILTLPQLDWESGMTVDRGCLLDPFHNPIPNLDPTKQNVAMVIGACLWLPRALWSELGGFPEWFESIAEDMYLCCRARLAGYPVQVTGSSYYRHHQGASFGGNRISGNRLASTYRRRRLSERNKTYVIFVCSPTIRLWMTLPLHLLLLALEGLLLTALKRDMRLWKEIYANVFFSLSEHSILLKKERMKTLKTSKPKNNYGRTFSLTPRKLQLLIRHGIPSLR